MRRIPVTLVVALLALCLTATAAFAARTTHTNAAPLLAGPTAVVVPDQPGPSVGDQTGEEAEPGDGDEDKDQDETTEDPSAHPSNHGLVVSEAAHATTPPGCKNHGEYVSLVARGLYTPDPNAAPLPEGQSVCDVAPDHGKPDAAAPGEGKPDVAPKPSHGHKKS